MSFLDHLDELRRRLVKAVFILAISFVVCFYFSKPIYDFLSIPVRKALSDAGRKQVQIAGLTGNETILSIKHSKVGDVGRYVFGQNSSINGELLPDGTTVKATVLRDANGQIGLFSMERLFTNNSIIPEGIRLPVKSSNDTLSPEISSDERMTVTTAQEQFTLYVTVSLYTAVALALPFLLFQIWRFVSPALYEHERSFVTVFIGLSTFSFVFGAAFAYYVLFPPAMNFLLNVGEGEFNLMLRATDYLDLIALIMLAMGLIFQMPAFTYVLARIGILSAGVLIRSWKIAIIAILIVAAVVSPTADVVNLLLFALPVMLLYVVSIVIAWLFGRDRERVAVGL